MRYFLQIVSSNFVMFFFIFNTGFSQTATMQSSGNWNSPGKWAGNNVGDNINEDIIIIDNVDSDIVNGFAYTVGNLTVGDDLALRVGGSNSSNVSSLTVGGDGNSKNMTVGENVDIYIRGTGSRLEVWGDMEMGDGISLNVYGALIVHGDVILNGDANFNTFSGSNTQVFGDLIGVGDVDFVLNSGAPISIAGDIEVGPGSSLGGSAPVAVGGTCSGSTAFCNNSLLPIELLSFDGSIDEGDILLNWTTASEQNFDFFEVEFSNNGYGFTKIATVRGTGYNTEIVKRYKYKHNNPAVGSNYYRLKSVDLDGAFEYSNVIRVSFESKKSISLSPNPLQGNSFQVRLNFTTEDPIRYAIVDNLGSVVGTGHLNGVSTQVELSKRLSQGIYTVRFYGESIQSSQRLVVR